MKFQIGGLSIAASQNGVLILKYVTQDHVLAAKLEVFDMPDNYNSISVDVEIYRKNDPYVIDKISRWEQDAEESAIS